MKIRPQILTLLFATVSTAAFVAACGSSGNSGSAGNVTPQCVEPGTSECTDSSSGIVCAEGETTGVAFSCESGEVCEEGACVGQCEPSSTQCLGSLAVRVCTEDGRE